MSCSRQRHRQSTKGTRTEVVRKRAGACRCGPTVASTRESGTKTRLTARVSFGMPMEMSMKVTGRMIRLTVTDFINTRTVPVTWVSGATTNRMATDLKLGQTEVSIKESIWMERSTDRASTSGLMVRSTRASGRITKSVALVRTDGLMAASTKATGLTITCMGRGSTRGAMDASTRVTTSTTKSMVREPMSGRMVDRTPVDGRMASRTGTDHTVNSMVRCVMESGLRASAHTGMTRLANSSIRKPLALLQRLLGMTYILTCLTCEREKKKNWNREKNNNK